MKKSVLVFIFFISLLELVSCKPTEKGYQAAYDAARNKREAAMADIVDVNMPKEGLQQVDGPQLREIDGTTVYVDNRWIKPDNSNERLPGSYNVAVGTYKMSTNARSQSEDLRKEGYKAFAALDADGKYYTIAGSFETLKEAVDFSKEYSKKGKRVYVGLPDAPVIIYSPVK